MEYLLLNAQDFNNAQNIGNSWSNMLSMVGQLFFLILVLIFILFLIRYCTKFINNTKYGALKNPNLKIVETISVGPQSYLHIVKVGDKIILIGVTKEKINFICDIDKDSLSLEEKEDTFQKTLESFFKKKKN